MKCARGNVCEYVLSRPCRRLSNFARNSRLAVSNFELVSLELQRFREVSKNDRDKLRAKFVWRWSCEPVPALRTYAGPANRPQPVPRPGPVVPPAPFALVVPGVPSWLASALPRIRYKTLPAWLLGGESGRKFSLLGVLLSKAVQNSPCMLKVRRIGPFQACWESFVPKWRGVVVVGRIVSCPGVVLVSVGGLWQRPGAAHGHCGRALRAPGVLHAGGDGGFALHEAFWRRVADVSDPRVVQFPPTGGGADAVCGGVVPKSQTTSAKNTENELLVAK